MKPKTKMQKEVATLSKTLRPITNTQKEWAYRNIFQYPVYRTKDGTLTCGCCGHKWHSDSTELIDNVCGCTCPKCGTELHIPANTRKRTDKQLAYFSVTTICKGYQVIRVASISAKIKKGNEATHFCGEVEQLWIAPNGKITVVALLRGMGLYLDQWSWFSEMEVRPNNPVYCEISDMAYTYPVKSVIPQLSRNGFKGDFHGISPVRLFKALLSDPRTETLMKAGEIEVMKYFISNPNNADTFWTSYLIAKRHRYHINNIGMWCDYLRMLLNFGEDIRNPKNICPTDFIEAHDKASRKIEAKRERKRTEHQRRADEERREREQQKLLQEKQREQDFIALKSKFFGLVISDNEISVKVLESIEEYYEEGRRQNICVFGAGYYNKAETLILSARIGDTIIETVEVDLQTLKVVQCHGRNNKNTPYHDRIVNLVNSNSKIIRERMTA